MAERDTIRLWGIRSALDYDPDSTGESSAYALMDTLITRLGITAKDEAINKGLIQYGSSRTLPDSSGETHIERIPEGLTKKGEFLIKTIVNAMYDAEIAQGRRWSDYDIQCRAEEFVDQAIVAYDARREELRSKRGQKGNDNQEGRGSRGNL